MKAKYSNPAALLLIFLLSLSGLIITLGHYAPQPSLKTVIEHNLPPGIDWYREQMPLYAQHAITSILHIIPAFMLMLLAPIQLIAKIRAKAPAVHRFIGRVFVGFAIVSALSGLLLAFVMPFGGLDETIVISFMFIGFIVSLFLGVSHIRNGNIAQHRYWMSRMLAFAYIPVTMRVFFMLGTAVYQLDPREIFALCLLIGGVLNLAVCEFWLHKRPIHYWLEKKWFTTRKFLHRLNLR